MLQQIKALGFALALVIILLPSIDYAETKKVDQLILELMAKSGLDQQIQQFPLLMQAAVLQQEEKAEPNQRLSKDKFEEFSRIVNTAFHAQVLRYGVQKHIRSGLNEREIEAVLSWLNTPLGQKITAMEESASTPEAYPKIQAMIDQLSQQQATRIGLIQRFDQATQATEFATDMTLNVEIAITSAISTTLPPQVQTAFDALMKEDNPERLRMKSTLEQQSLAMLLYTYQTLSDTELDQYIAFAESELGKKYHTVSQDAINKVILNSCQNMGKMIGRSLQKK